MYSFIRNDKHSFTEWSRIYDVYNEDGEIETSLVVGYDQTLSEYFVCYHAIERFHDYYGHYPKDSALLWIDIMLEFIDAFENAWDASDVISENCILNPAKMPKLTRDKLYYYLPDCSGYNYVDECPRYEMAEEDYIDELLITKCLIPYKFEGSSEVNDDEIYPFTEEDYNEYIDECDCVDSIYCKIDFNAMMEYMYNTYNN